MDKIIRLETILTKQEYKSLSKIGKLRELYISKKLTFKNKKESDMEILIKTLNTKSIYLALKSSGVVIRETIFTYTTKRIISLFDILGIFKIVFEEKSFIINIEPDFSKFEDYISFLYYRFYISLHDINFKKKMEIRYKYTYNQIVYSDFTNIKPI